MADKVEYDSGNAEHVAKRNKELADESKDLEWIMSQPRGRRWMHELIFNTCHLERPSHVPADPDSTAFNEGSRAIAIQLVADLKVDYMGQYIKMLEEQNNG